MQQNKWTLDIVMKNQEETLRLKRKGGRQAKSRMGVKVTENMENQRKMIYGSKSSIDEINIQDIFSFTGVFVCYEVWSIWFSLKCVLITACYLSGTRFLSKPEKVPSQLKKLRKQKTDIQYYSCVSCLWRFPSDSIQWYANLTIFMGKPSWKTVSFLMQQTKFLSLCFFTEIPVVL